MCDGVTGCGHSLWGWEFYRSTKVLYGNVIVGRGSAARLYPNPAPTSLLWRPDRLTARYELEPGVALEETKFFTNTDVLLDIISLIDNGTAAEPVAIALTGGSYVNPKPVPRDDPSSRGLPPGAEHSVKRNSSVSLDGAFARAGCGAQGGDRCSAVRILESGTGYAKPIDCKFAPFPEGVDCRAREGPMMYDGMSVFLASSQDISKSVRFGRDSDRRATYNFTVELSSGSPVVLGWAMGDDEASTRTRIAQFMTPAAAGTVVLPTRVVDARLLTEKLTTRSSIAASALAARTAAAEHFLTEEVPQLNVTLAASRTPGNEDSAAHVAWDVRSRYACDNKHQKYKFLSGVADVAACKEACAELPSCVEFEWKLDAPHWCALYNISSFPHPNPKYDCGCRGTCQSSPSPSPSPSPPPSPIPPMNRTLDFNNAYYFGWAMCLPPPPPSYASPSRSVIPVHRWGFRYWMMTLDSQRGPFEKIGHAQSAPNNFLGLHLHDTQ